MLAKTSPQSGSPFAIEEARYGDDVIVLSLSGELDLAVIEIAKAALEPIADRPELAVIDLTDLEFLDSSGVAALYAFARARSDMDSVRLLPSRHDGVNRNLQITDVGSVIRIVAG
jgi:anti-anti-sigma factor